MKNRLLKIALATIAIFQSATLIAQDYSGRHYSDDEGGSIIDMIPIPIVIILIIICAIALWGQRDKN